MATIVPTSMTGPAGINARPLTETTMTASDTFAWQAGSRQILTLRNGTAGALSPAIAGSLSTTINVAGAIPLSVASYAVGSIAAGATRTILLDNISEFLQGTITITAGTGLSASLYNFV